MPAMTDFTLWFEAVAYMFVTGPDAVKTVTSEDVTAEELGGAATHTTRSSVADGAFDNDLEVLQIRRLVGFLPAYNAAPPQLTVDDDPARTIPALDSLLKTQMCHMICANR